MSLRHADPLMARGWASVPTQVLVQTGLSVGARLLYTLILSYLNDNSRAWPGQERLGHELGVSDRTIRTWMTELRDAGLVDIERRGLGMSNLYTVTGSCSLPAPDPFEASDPERKQTSGQERKQDTAQVRNQASGEPGLGEPGPKEPSAAAARASEPVLSQEADDAGRMLQEAGVQILDGGFLHRLAATHPEVDLIEVARIAIKRHRTGGIRGSRDRYIAGIVTGDSPPLRATGRAGVRTTAPRRPTAKERAEWSRSAGPAEDALWLEVTGGAA